MVTEEPPKLYREGSIPSRPAFGIVAQPGRVPGLHPSDASSNLADSTSRVSFNGRTAVFQTADVGSIPIARSDSLAPPARWTSTRPLSEPFQVRLLGGALSHSSLSSSSEDVGFSRRKRGCESRPGHLSPCPAGCRHRSTKPVGEVRLLAGRRSLLLPPTWRTQARASEA